MKMKRTVMIILAMLMLVTVIAGCNKQEADNAATTSTKQEATAKPEAKVTEAPEEIVMGYPIVEDGSVTLKYWLPIHPNAAKFIRDYGENEAFQELEKKTGVKVEYIHPTIGNEKENFNLLLVSGDLPDMMMIQLLPPKDVSKYKGGEFKGVNDGVFLNLKDYLEDYAPDYNELINSNSDVQNAVFGSDGEVAAFYKLNFNPTPPARRFIMRKDWLDEFGMDTPKTLNDIENYLKNAKETKDIAPYLFTSTGKEELLIGAYNILPDFYRKDDKVSLGIIQPEFKEYLALMNKWWEAGYISKDFTTFTNDPSIEPVFGTGDGGLYVGSVDTAYSKFTVAMEIAIESAPEPRLNENDAIHTRKMDFPLKKDVTVISNSSENKEIAVRWMNYAYTEEGSNIYNYGVEGKSWNMVDGKPQYTDYMLNNPDLPTNNALWILRVHFTPKLETASVLDMNPTIVKNVDGAAFRKRWSDYPNTDFSYRLPPIQLTSEELDARTSIMTQVNTYADEMILKFVVGVEPISNFDKYLEDLKAFGVDEAVAITQDAYDRFINK